MVRRNPLISAGKSFGNKFLGRKKGGQRKGEQLLPMMMMDTNSEQLVSDKSDLPAIIETEESHAIDIPESPTSSEVSGLSSLAAGGLDGDLDYFFDLSVQPTEGQSNQEQCPELERTGKNLLDVPSINAKSEGGYMLDPGQAALFIAVLVACFWTYQSEKNGVAATNSPVVNHQKEKGGIIGWNSFEAKDTAMSNLSPVFQGRCSKNSVIASTSPTSKPASPILTR
jgi:hypothetical protein